MRKKHFNIDLGKCCLMHFFLVLLSLLPTTFIYAQAGSQTAINELIDFGFENIRFTENETERIYTIENNVYKAEGVGLSKAIEIIQKHELQDDKTCKIIVMHLDVPEILLTRTKGEWQTSYDLGNSWKEVKGEKVQNSSRFKADILLYPQLSYKNLIITQIYQALFTINPALEVSLWPGMKLTGQVIVPIYNDGYSMLNDKVRPGFITLSQRFRLPFNIKAKATIGYFNVDRYGCDLTVFRPFRDERFSVEGRIGTTGIGYWDGFKLHYDKDLSLTWTLGANFYWPRYNTQFSLKGEKYLMGEKGVKFEMIRHFRYASIGFYATKAEKANANGGFRFQVLLPPYKYKRFKNKYIPRINTSYNMGIMYNAGNEEYYYRQYRSEANENIMNSNRFNPFFIKSELSNNY